MTKKPTPLLLSPPPPKSIVSLARANGPKPKGRTKMLQQRNRKRTSIFRTDTTTKSANRFDDLFCISWMLSLHFYTINPLLKIQLVYKSSKKVFGQYPSLTSRLVNNRGLLLTDIAWSSQYPVNVIRASVTHLGCYCHTWHSNEFRNFIFLKYVPKGSVPYKSMDDALNLQFDARKRHRVWWKPSVGYSNKSFWCHDQGRKLNKFQFLSCA